MNTEEIKEKREHEVLAELPQCCATCRHWTGNMLWSGSRCEDSVANRTDGFYTPANGLCRRWVPIRYKKIVAKRKAATKAKVKSAKRVKK